MPKRGKRTSASRRKPTSKLQRQRSKQRNKSKSPIERKRSKRGVITLTRKQIAAQLAKQDEQTRQNKQKRKSGVIRNSFKATKKDRGKIVFVGLDGKRLTGNTRRKGILVYVTKAGKKELVKQAGRQGYTPTKRKNLELPTSKKLNKALFKFRKRVLIGKGKAKRPQLRGKLRKSKLVKEKDGSAGQVNGSVAGEWGNDFNDKLVKSLVRSLQAAIKAQQSHRTFIIAVYLLIETEDGEEHSVYMEVSIDAADHRSIVVGGVESFIRKKFYAQLAKQLSFRGYVSSGSDNHVRKLKENDGAETSELEKDGMPWEGRDKDVVLIKLIEWQIQQA